MASATSPRPAPPPPLSPLPESGAKNAVCDVVRLNVGGVLFTTSAATLLASGESFFSGLLSGKFASKKDDAGAFFVDRNGRYFEPILDFLRTGVVYLPPGIPLEPVLEEANYFCIDIAGGLAGLVKEGLYTQSGMHAEGSIMMIEKDENPGVVGITGVIDKRIFCEHVCPVVNGKIIVQTPTSQLHIQPSGHNTLTARDPNVFRSLRQLEFSCGPSTAFPLPHKSYSFDVPSLDREEDREDDRTCQMTFFQTQEGTTARISFSGAPSLFGVRVLCKSLLMLYSPRPYALIYLSGSVPFLLRHDPKKSVVRAIILRQDDGEQ